MLALEAIELVKELAMVLAIVLLAELEATLVGVQPPEQEVIVSMTVALYAAAEEANKIVLNFIFENNLIVMI